MSPDDLPALIDLVVNVNCVRGLEAPIQIPVESVDPLNRRTLRACLTNSRFSR
jgi:hypothetical protein